MSQLPSIPKSRLRRLVAVCFRPDYEPNVVRLIAEVCLVVGWHVLLCDNLELELAPVRLLVQLIDLRC